MQHASRLTIAALAALLLVLNLTAAEPAAAQESGPVIETLTIQLWPEFDQPSMLVLYDGSVSGTDGETTFLFTLPAGATFHVAAYEDPDRGLIETTYDQTGNSVAMKSPNGTFHIEFYDPGLDTTSPQREYTYTWSGDYPVQTLTWLFQVPPTATDLSFDPQAEGPSVGAMGLDYYTLTQTNLDQGAAVPFTVHYTRLTSALTSSPSGGNLPQTGGEDTAASAAPASFNPMTAAGTVLVIAGLGALGGGLYFYNKRHPDVEPSEPASERRPTASAVRRFCTQCGTQALEEDDRFCRSCGAALR